MLRSNVCDYSDAYILITGTIIVTALAAGGGNNNILIIITIIIIKIFTNCVSEINNTQIDNAKDIGVVIPMYNLIEDSNSYSKAYGSLWQYYRDGPALINAGALADFPSDSTLFKF